MLASCIFGWLIIVYHFTSDEAKIGFGFLNACVTPLVLWHWISIDDSLHFTFHGILLKRRLTKRIIPWSKCKRYQADTWTVLDENDKELINVSGVWDYFHPVSHPSKPLKFERKWGIKKRLYGFMMQELQQDPSEVFHGYRQDEDNPLLPDCRTRIFLVVCRDCLWTKEIEQEGYSPYPPTLDLMGSLIESRIRYPHEDFSRQLEALWQVEFELRA